MANLLRSTLRSLVASNTHRIPGGLMAAPNNNLALLIDGDNASAQITVGLMAEIANYGTASVRRIYGDWTSPQLASWKDRLLHHSITPIQQFAYTKGKNATDGAMIIDAMDLLYTERFSGFCIVSSDSDFTRLAARIREQGVTVYGFGERVKTGPAFIAACDKFMYFDALISEPKNPMATQPKPNKPTAPVQNNAQPKKRPIDKAALKILAEAIANAPSCDENWVNLGEVGNIIIKIAPDLQARNYGYKYLKDFVDASGLVDLKIKSGGSYVRLKKGLV